MKSNNIIAPDIDFIRELKEAPAPPAERHIREAIESHAQMVKSLNEQERFDDFEKARAEEAALRAEIERAGADRDLARQELEKAPRGSIVEGVSFTLGAVSCFVAEFVITWIALCFLLSVPMMSTRGVLLGLAPATALLVIHWIYRQLGLSGNPFKRMASLVRTWQKWTAFALVSGFLVALAWANVNMVVLLAQGREQAIKIRKTYETQSTTSGEPDEVIISQGILWVSVMVTLSGAALFMVGTDELRSAGNRVRLQLRVAKFNRRLANLRSLHTTAEASFNIHSKKYAQAGAEAERAAAYCRSKNLFELEQVKSRPRTALELVNERMCMPAMRL